MTKRILFWWLPLPLRLLSAGLTAFILGRELPDFVHWLPLLSAQGESFPIGGLWVISALAFVALLMIASGTATRAVAISLLALALFDQLAVGFVWPTNGLLQICTILLIQVGGGVGAVYKLPLERET